MKRHSESRLAGALALAILLGASGHSEDKEFESPPVLQAVEILPADLRSGPHHEVESSVSVQNFELEFNLKTESATEAVRTLPLLRERVRELAAISKLSEISQTQAFITSFSESAKNPVVGAWKVASRPVSTISGLPSGAGRYLKGTFYRLKKVQADVSESVTEVGSVIAKPLGDQDEDGESITKQATRLTNEASKEHLGFNKAKRLWAKRMNVDPYSQRPDLQKALDRISWATSLGSFAADYSIPPVVALDYANEAQNLVWETPPIELERMNDERLLKAGIQSKTARSLHEHPNYTLTQKTAIALAIEALAEVERVATIVDIVLNAENSREAAMLVEVIAMHRIYHESKTPLSRFEIRRGMLAGVDQDDTLILPVAIEVLYWTPLVKEVAEDESLKHPKRHVLISGFATDTSIEKLARLDWEITQNGFNLSD